MQSLVFFVVSLIARVHARRVAVAPAAGDQQAGLHRKGRDEPAHRLGLLGVFNSQWTSFDILKLTT